MSEFAFGVLLRTTLVLTASAIVVRGLLWAFPPRRPAWHQVAWAFVLLQGWLVVQWDCEIPWYAAERTPASVEEPAFLAPVFPRHASAAPVASQDALAGDVRGFPSVRDVCLATWMLGMGAWLAAVLVCYTLLWRAARQAVPACATWQQQWEALLSAHSVGPHIQLHVHPRVGPLLCWLPGGYRVIVPADKWQRFTEAQRRAILEHEIAHYLRGDIWRGLFVRFLALPHWFNPLASWTVRKFEETSEWACDARLDPRSATQLARALLELAEPPRRQLCVSAASGACLKTRLRRLLNEPVQEDSALRRVPLLLGVALLATAGLLRVQLVAQESVAFESERLDERLSELAERIAPGESELQDRFRAALATPAGQIVVRDRIAHIEASLRERAEGDAIPGYLLDRFVQRPGRTGCKAYAPSRRVGFPRFVRTGERGIQLGRCGDEAGHRHAGGQDGHRLGAEQIGPPLSVA